MSSRVRKFASLLAIAILTIAVSTIWYRSRPSTEPSYEGYPLSVWIQSIGRTQPESMWEVPIQAIGTNAIPWLVQWIQYDPTKQALRLDRLLHFIHGHEGIYAKIKLGDNAAIAIQALGPAAEPAIPALSNLLIRSKSASIQERAAVALAGIGKPAFPHLVAILKNQDQRVPARLFAGIAVAKFGTNAQPAVPILLECLKEESMAFTTAWVLGELKLEAELVVPALTNLLVNPEMNIRQSAARSLGNFGEIANSAVPLLTSLLDDPNPVVRVAATNALRQIDPHSLTNTPNP